jgi:hypothetical protein
MGRRGSWVTSSATGGTPLPGDAVVRFEPTSSFPTRITIVPTIDQFVEVAAFNLAVAQNLDNIQIPVDPVSVGIVAAVDILSDIINPDGIVISSAIDQLLIDDTEYLVVIAPNLSALAIPIDVVNGATVAAVADAMGLDSAAALSMTEFVDSFDIPIDGNLIAVAPKLTLVWDYTVANTYTWDAPVTGSVLVQLWAAGGGGDSTKSTQGSGGGGSGQFAQLNAFAATGGSSYTLVVGAGGFGVTPATAGGDTTFNTTSCIAKGGQGGTPGTPTNHGNGGAGGTGGTGDVLRNGSAGGGAGGIQVNGGGGGGSPGTTGSGGAGNANVTGGTAGTGGGAVGANGATATSGPAATTAGYPGAGGGGAATLQGPSNGAAGRAILTMVVV